MTRVSQNRILKEANGDISDHLRSHIHLTNCIHLKNHMHKQSPVFADRALMRDLIVLQRSRSLRDPSASPPGWNSPSIMDLLPKKGDKDRDKDSGVREGRRSVDKPSRRLSGLGNLSPVANFSTSRVSPAEQLDIESGVKDGLRVRREESSRRSYRDEEQNQRDHFTVQNAISGHSESKGSKKSVKPSRHEDIHAKTISDQLNEVATGDSDDVVSSNVRPRVKYSGGGVNRAKRRKFRSTRKARAAKDVGGKSEMSVASNSLARGSARNRYAMENEEGEEEVVDQNVTRAPKNGCGIPFNWSRIHHRGKTFLDLAGRSLSCGLSDSRVRKGGSNASEMPMTSDESSSFTKSDAEALPLLIDSAENDDWVHDYSGELGIFADNLLKNNDSDLASEAGSGGNKHRRKGQQQHQSLTQKYMPKSFRDLMGQNLVVQALSNAVSRKKIGFLYVFYGPHGTGKTSCARIFARALNCRSLDHPKPCGVCSSCLKNLSGKSRNVREVSPVGNLGFENLVDLLDNMIIPQLPSHYRVFIFDDCDNLSVDCWNAISKVVDRAPRDVVFILVCSSLDVLPHMIVSRCQKFFFPKLKDADIIYSLQWIASNEEIEIDKDALKLIASRSDGSLRDAEMTLEQLSLLGQRISVPLVQELVGLISDGKLVDLLDLALSADTVNTVKNLRMIMETGVEPLALMSQLATVITDILAGSYDFTKDQHRRKFFRRKPLLKEDMEKLRQALKTLSEAEKQLRMSNDKPTWLTAALLQLAPDQQYMLPNSSVETSSGHSPLALNNAARRGDSVKDGAMESIGTDRRRQASVGGGQVSGRNRPGNDEIWLEVLEKVQVNGLKEFLLKEGKIVSFSLGAAPTVRLMFSSPLTKSTAEKFRGHILQAFESVLGSPVTIEIRCEPKKVSRTGPQPLSLPAAAATVLAHTAGRERNTGALSEIVEIRESPREKGSAVGGSSVGRRRPGELGQSQSIVRGKVSLAHVIQQAEGQRNGGWSKRKAVSIAEKLEQENLRLEPRSRSLLCWKTSRATRRKLSRLRLRTRRPHTLLKLVSCGKCLSSRSPR